MATAIRIVRLRAADGPAAAELLATTWRSAYRDLLPALVIAIATATWHTQERVLAAIAADSVYYAGAWEEKKLQGIVLVEPVDTTTGRLAQLYVRPDVHRRGIGSRLLESALAASTRRSRMTVEVEQANAPAIAFFEARGFHFTGVTEVELAGHRIPCVTGELLIPPPGRPARPAGVKSEVR